MEPKKRPVVLLASYTAALVRKGRPGLGPAQLQSHYA